MHLNVAKQSLSLLQEQTTIIIEEHKLYYNPHIISLMFMQEPQLHNTWDVHWSVQPKTHDVNQGIHGPLMALTTDLTNANLNHWICRYIDLQQH